MQDLSTHILDVAENATAAGATLIEIRLAKESARDRLELVIRDNGHGMDDEMARRARDPFVTSRTTRRVGLGLPLLEQSAREAEGDLSIVSKPGQGTEVTAVFKASHIDLKPVGDFGATVVSLILGAPDVDFVFDREEDGEVAHLDTRELRRELEGTPLSDPRVLAWARSQFERA